MGQFQIKGQRGPFAEAPGRSWTLPSRYYVDPELYAREQKRIFEKSWCYVGHVGELPYPGDYLTEEVAGQPILVVRGRDQVLRAFYNVCQHRGHLLMKGCGRLAAAGLTCPYHAWTYGLDGKLIAARLTEDVEGFDKRDFSLVPLRLTQVAGLIFVNLDPDAPAFEEFAPGFEKTLTDHLPGLATFATAHRLTFDIAANWKVCVDNFSEAYHIPVAHPELAKLHGGQPKASVVGEHFAFYRNVGRSTYQGFRVKPDEPYVSWTLFPHHCLLSLPGKPHLIMLRMTPMSVARTIERADILTPVGPPAEEVEKVKDLFAQMFNQEDIAIVEAVQKGLSSKGYDQGRYVVDSADSWFSESALHKFHRLVVKALA